MKHTTTLSLLLTLFILNCKVAMAQQTYSESLETLGRLLFFDTRLSHPEGRSCASCHNPDNAYADKGVDISAGALPALLGKRNTPSISYASLTPKWHFNLEDETWIGGFFADGRALTLEEQAIGPFFAPLEMALPSETFLLEKIQSGPYSALIESSYGNKVWQDASKVMSIITQALAAFQSSDTFAPRFSSKYDAYLRGEVTLSKRELNGLKLYEAEDKGNCAACHQSKIGENGQRPLFTDFSYDNLGIPKNTKLAFLQRPSKHNPAGTSYVDIGLGFNPNIKSSGAQSGKFKVPTLRNIAVTSPYMHNGFFSDLTDAVEFYNSRDIEDKWSQPEVSENVNTDELGDLKLTKEEVDDIVLFLHTLTDGWVSEESNKLANN